MSCEEYDLKREIEIYEVLLEYFDVGEGVTQIILSYFEHKYFEITTPHFFTKYVEALRFRIPYIRICGTEFLDGSLILENDGMSELLATSNITQIQLAYKDEETFLKIVEVISTSSLTGIMIRTPCESQRRSFIFTDFSSSMEPSSMVSLESWKLLAKALMHSKLRWLSFMGIDFEDDSFEILFEGLQANHTIKRLNICDNFFTEEQSIILANHIMGLHNSITHFGFNLRNTPSYHVKHLTHALEQDTVVESLDWGDSRTLDYLEKSMLATMLEENSTIRNLNLGRCGIDGMDIVMNALKHNSTIQVIRMCNYGGDDVCFLIADLIRSNLNIRQITGIIGAKFNLTYNGLDAVAKALRVNTKCMLDERFWESFETLQLHHFLNVAFMFRNVGYISEIVDFSRKEGYNDWSIGRLKQVWKENQEFGIRNWFLVDETSGILMRQWHGGDGRKMLGNEPIERIGSPITPGLQACEWNDVGTEGLYFNLYE